MRFKDEDQKFINKKLAYVSKKKRLGIISFVTYSIRVIRRMGNR